LLSQNAQVNRFSRCLNFVDVFPDVGEPIKAHLSELLKARQQPLPCFCDCRAIGPVFHHPGFRAHVHPFLDLFNNFSFPQVSYLFEPPLYCLADYRIVFFLDLRIEAA
jgi:hypothetical protein